MNWKYSAIIACLASYSFGLQISLISSVLLFIDKSFPRINDGWIPFVVASPLLGALIGAWGISIVADRWGRRPSLIAVHSMLLLASLLQSVSVSLWMLVVVRFLVLGWAIGACTAFVPIYISELVPAHSRGFYGTLVQLSVTSGIISSFFIGYLVAWLINDSSLNWRFMLALPSIISFICLLFSSRIGETDGWLEFIAYKRLNDNPEYPELDLSTDYDHNPSLFQTSVLHAVTINILQQTTGFNVLVYYSGLLFSQMGFNDMGALLASGISAVPQLLCLLFVATSIDRFGRKTLFTCALCFLLLGMLGLAFVPDRLSSDSDKRIAVLVLIIFVRISFSLGAGPIAALYSSEILSSEIRARGMALASICNWIANFTVNFTYIPLGNFLSSITHSSSSIFYAYSLFIAIGICWSIFYMKETKNTILR